MRISLSTMVVIMVVLASTSSSAIRMVPLKNFYNANFARFYYGNYGHVNINHFCNMNGFVRLQCEQCACL